MEAARAVHLARAAVAVQPPAEDSSMVSMTTVAGPLTLAVLVNREAAKEVEQVLARVGEKAHEELMGRLTALALTG